MRRCGPRVLAVALGALLVVVLTSCGPGTSTGAGTTELRFAYFSGEQTSFGRLWSWWMDEVERRTGGSVTFDPFWDASLLTGPEMIEGLRDGRADIVQVTPTMYPGKFPLTSVSELPFVSNNVPAGAHAIAELAERDPAMREEWEQRGLKPLAWNVASPGALGTTEPVERVEDLRGLSLRGNDRSSQVLGMAGANLVNLDLNEIYTGTERGLLDGFFGIPFAFVGPLKLPEVAKNYTDVGMGITSANALTMSLEGWQELTPAQQRVMTEVSEMVPTKLAEFDGELENASCTAVQAAGGRVSQLPQAEVDRLRAIGEQRVREEWIAEVRQEGIDGAAFYQEWVSAVTAAEARYPQYRLGMARCMDRT